jgi:hypothetical protein
MATLNYTTTIPASRTVAEMQTLLVKHGAASVATHYDEGRAAGLSFTLRTPHGDRTFTMPVDTAAVNRLLIKQERDGLLKRQKRKGYYSDPAHAERVAWRVAKDWLAAQLALIEAQMATLDQVMLPYLHVDGERTLYAVYRDRESVALPSGSVQ